MNISIRSGTAKTESKQASFFIDGLNEVKDPKRLEYLLGLLPQVLPSGVAVALTAPSYSAVSSFLGGRISNDSVIKLPPLSIWLLPRILS